MALTQKILVEYKRQNAKKFAEKFGTLDPEQLEGVIGMTNPTPFEMAQGKAPQPIWREYSLGEVRQLGGVEIKPAQLNGILPPQFPTTAQAPAPVAPAEVKEDKPSKAKK